MRTAHQVEPPRRDNRDLSFVPAPVDLRSIPRPPNLIYDLRGEDHTSQACYADIEVFSERVLAEIEQRASSTLDEFARYLQGLESPRSRGEYALELLTLGMALRVYAPMARRTSLLAVGLARLLLQIRHRSQRLKPKVDFVRAWLFRRVVRKRAAPSPALPNVAFLGRLIAWLRASGEFDQESLRLENWRRYLRSLPTSETAECLRISAELFAWFERASEDALGRYTRGVNDFLAGEYTRRPVREDQLFCGRRPAEYHLNMVAAEIMNRGLGSAFDNRPRKAVLLPACMRGARAATCRARIRGVDMTCAACDPECAINRITRQLRPHGVPVYIVPHASGFSRWLERWQQEHEVGVIAVACLLNIAAGGFEMRARGIASQCVLLDYPGCEKHWRSQALPTGVNESRLVQIAMAKQPRT